MNMRKRYDLVLAIYLTGRGFTYVLFEGSMTPLIWRIARRDGCGKSRRCLRSITGVIRRHQPDVLVLQDTSWTGTPRPQRIMDLNRAIFTSVQDLGIPVCAFSRDRVRAAFGQLGSPSKYAIAEAIAKHIPFFARYLPPPRKPWMAEDTRMSLFDAAALALTFFQDGAAGGAAAA